MDGYGDSDNFTEECEQPPGTSTMSGDCNDMDATINPGAEDVPNNGMDENCDGMDQLSSTDDTIVQDMVTIYPNPTSKTLTIESNSPNRLKVQIYNNQGIFILGLEMSGMTKKIDLSALSPGLYIFKANSETDLYISTFVKI